MAGRAVKVMLAAGLALALAGCEEGAQPFGFLGGGDADREAAAAAPEGTTRLVERDVEAPQVFQVTEAGLWDGRPSLGGVWVAFPGVSDPERVIIRNPANGKFVIGALFRRERENPGPKLQVSSDAAAALGLLAGQPAQLSVTALRREDVPEAVEAPAQPILDTAETIETETLAPAPSTATIPSERAGAAPAPTAAPAATPAATTRPAARPEAGPAAKPAAKPAASASAGGRNLLQIGIFSVEANANRAAEQVKKAGATASVRKEETQGKASWRVLAGPAATPAEREALLDKIRKLGYADAYFVSR